MSHSWRLDDLDGGLAADLSDLQGLGADLIANPQAYNMADVLSLSMFKTEDDPLARLSHSPFDNLRDVRTESAPSSSSHMIASKAEDERFAVVLKAPVSLGRKFNEDTLTYLNQGQSLQLLLHCLNRSGCTDTRVKTVISLGFHERKNQIMEREKFDEWIALHPSEKILEIDAPMCIGVSNIKTVGAFFNAYEFEWDVCAETRLYFKINCVSSDFTRGKSGGESGVILRLQCNIAGLTDNGCDANDDCLCYCCQVKVFKPKGADRKMKSERQKYDSLTPDRQDQLHQPCDVTVLRQICFSDDNPPLTSPQTSPPKDHVSCSSQFSQMNLSTASCASPQTSHQHSKAAIAIVQALTSNSTVEETQTWLSINRFHNFKTTFENFAGTDLLRLTRDDLIQLCGTADGIRLNNALQSRASRPLLTVYVSPEWGQGSAPVAMKEYHAVFLEELTVLELKHKLSLKCSLDNNANYITLYKQGPAGILIRIDDDMVQNFADESHFHVKMTIEDELHARIILI